jgi:diguanylate cyclase (GGDEF)-like protein/putative nucleotidyltransferase with HDIG domain
LGFLSAAPHDHKEKPCNDWFEGMSALPSENSLVPEPVSGRNETLSRNARIYFFFVALATAAATLPFLNRLQDTHEWLGFLVLGSCAAVAQLFNVRTPRDQAYHTAIVFLVAAALILPPELVVLMGIVQHVPEWLKMRYRWYLQTFNICIFVLASMAVWFVAKQLLLNSEVIGNHALGLATAGLIGCVVFVAINHFLLAVMLHFARGHTLKETGLFDIENLSTDFVLAALGVATYAFWETNQWLIPFAIAPLILVHRSLAVPALQAEARVDPKTGLFNARHFAAALSEEIGRARRFERPMSLIMADLDLLRDINNTYGHLAGDAVLKGIAEVFRAQLRHYDVPARFGGEEFSILLPETPPEQALEIAERIRRAVAERTFDVETSSDPIRATVSIGVAGYPKDGTDSNELIHQADLAVYRAKLQGRNRVLGASSEPLLVPTDRTARLIAVPEDGDHHSPLPAAVQVQPKEERRNEPRHPKPHALHGPRFLSLDRRLSLIVGLVSALGVSAGIVGLVLTWTSKDLLGLLAVLALVGVGQALALEADEGSAVLSVSAVGCLAAASLFGWRAALPLAITSVAVDWSARRHPLHNTLFNVGALTLASLAAASVFKLAAFVPDGTAHRLAVSGLGLVAGGVYFVVNMGLVSVALGLEGHERWWAVFKERFAWLLPHYLVYGFIGGVMALAYEAVKLLALAVFAVPLLLMRKTQEAYLKHTQRSAQKLRQAAETIQSQNVSLEQANKLLKARSTAAMESLSATVDARDSYTAGHSRRVQQLALAIGRELGLSQAELDLLGHAALFHDIGKLAIPDAILLKPASLTPDEWSLMQRHAEEGARIIDRLGFLNDAVPAIRHHHERFDGTGYPDRLQGEEIPLGARIIHVADALDSMLTTRIYRAARPAAEALQELRRAAGTQFCPRCVGALDRILPLETLQGDTERRLSAVAS